MTSAKKYRRGHQLFLRKKEDKIMLTSFAFIFLVGLSLAAICQKEKEALGKSALGEYTGEDEMKMVVMIQDWVKFICP